MTSSSEFKFGEENEFLYNGKLYDVVRQKTDGVKIIFYCINDTNEEKLIVELNRYANLNSNQNIPVKQKTNLLINNIIKEALPENSKSFFSNTADFNIHFIYKSLLTKQYIPILCPPPKA